MTITLSQQDYKALMYETPLLDSSPSTDDSDQVWRYPEVLGRGYHRSFDVQEGIELDIAHYCLHDRFVMPMPERSHPLEYTVRIAADPPAQPLSCGHYSIYGSGLAPSETNVDQVTSPIIEISVHIEPGIFQSFIGDSCDLASVALDHLIRSADQKYYQRSGIITPAMQMVVHQLLHCPFHGIVKKMYVESKVWELMALLIEQEQALRQTPSSSSTLKPDDVERIYHARDILLKQMNHPPSLLELARQVGLNDCTLKRGFRQVFGKTAFGYLHDHRLEQARQLLQKRHLNVSEVARAIGFANRSYFAAAFRKKFGVSPKDYLAQHKNSV